MKSKNKEGLLWLRKVNSQKAVVALGAIGVASKIAYDKYKM